MMYRNYDENTEHLFQLEEFPHLFIGGGRKGHFMVYNHIYGRLYEAYNVDCLSAVTMMIEKADSNFCKINDLISLVTTVSEVWKDKDNYSFSKCYNRYCKHLSQYWNVVTQDCMGHITEQDCYCTDDVDLYYFEKNNMDLVTLNWESNKRYNIFNIGFTYSKRTLYATDLIDGFTLQHSFDEDWDVNDALLDFVRYHKKEELHPSSFEKFDFKGDKFALPLEYMTISEMALIYCGILGISLFDAHKRIIYDNQSWCDACIRHRNNTKTIEQMVSEIPLIKPSLNQKQPVSKKNTTINRNQQTEGYDDWKFKVTNRDNHTCAVCGYNGKHLERHHLFGYAEHPELATNVNNGITLCKWCHQKYHSMYGKKNINPIDFMEFIKQFGVKV